MRNLTEGYSIFMALQDYVPVALSSLGLFFLMRMVAAMSPRCEPLARAGWLLVTAGGFSKATWKLIMAASNSASDVKPLDDALFFLMGSGFLLMTFAVGYAQREKYTGKGPFGGSIWRVPVLIAGVTVASGVLAGVVKTDSRAWFFIMLTLTTAANFATGALVIKQGRAFGSAVVMLLFGFNLLAILMLTGMARVDPQTIPLEWAAQITNTISNAAFAFAAWKLYRLTVGGVEQPAARGSRLTAAGN